MGRYGMTRHFYHVPTGMTPRRRKRETEKERVYRLAQEERERCQELARQPHHKPWKQWTDDVSGRCEWLRTKTAAKRHDEKEKVRMEMRLQKVKEQATYRSGKSSKATTERQQAGSEDSWGLGGNTGHLEDLFQTRLNPWIQVQI